MFAFNAQAQYFGSSKLYFGAALGALFGFSGRCFKSIICKEHPIEMQ